MDGFPHLADFFPQYVKLLLLRKLFSSGVFRFARMGR